MSTLVAAPPTLFDALESLPLRPASAAAALGRTAVIAPHPDDESLGCGGLLALLGRDGVAARVVVVTDGTRSHPRSRAYPAPRLRALREREAREAVRALGLPPSAVTFLRHPDCGVPEPGDDTFESAADDLAACLEGSQTVLAPWRRDPHCDHEGAWRLARAAVAQMPTRPRWLEYAVWARVAGGETAPRPDEAHAWRLDISDVLGAKRAAIAAHRSQTTRLIADDPDGFCLTPAHLAHFDHPWEVFVEPHDAPALRAAP